MSGLPPQVLERFQMLIEAVEPLLFLARDRGLQMQAVSEVNTFLDELAIAQLAAIQAHDEAAANDLLGLSFALRSLAAELNCYLLLKDEQPERAWDALIDARDAVSAASRVMPGHPGLGPKFGRLRELEAYLFPPQIFMSAGMIVRTHECSICREPYGECDHVAGRPYMGRLCSIILKDIEADHVAIVDDPADRRCRITAFSVPGGMRNRMTWVVTPKEEAPAEDHTEGIAIRSDGAVN